MTEHQLQDILDILHWASRQSKTDGLYERIVANKKIVQAELDRIRQESINKEIPLPDGVIQRSKMGFR